MEAAPQENQPEKKTAPGQVSGIAPETAKALGPRPQEVSASEMNGHYPVNLEVDYPMRSSRWWALGTLLFMVAKVIAIIPHAIALYVLNFVFLFVFIFGQVAVLFTGKYPKGLFDFNAGYLRWRVRVNAFVIGLTDKYPPFRLKK